MKPSFAEYNSVAADACQILAVIEIHYSTLSSSRVDNLRAEACRALRIGIGNIVLEVARNYQAKPPILDFEETAIQKLKKAFAELGKKLPAWSTEIKQALAQDERPFKLAAVLFSEDPNWGIFNIYRLQSNLDIVLYQEKSFQPRTRTQNEYKVITNIFMQPCSAIECEERANIKLADIIAARVAQFQSLYTMDATSQIAGSKPNLLMSAG